MITHEEDAESDYVLEFSVVVFGGAGIEKIVWGTPRFIAVTGTMVDVHQETVVLEFNQSAIFNWLPGYSQSEEVDKELARQMSEDIVKSLRGKMSPA